MSAVLTRRAVLAGACVTEASVAAVRLLAVDVAALTGSAAVLGLLPARVHGRDVP